MLCEQDHLWTKRRIAPWSVLLRDHLIRCKSPKCTSPHADPEVGILLGRDMEVRMAYEGQESEQRPFCDVSDMEALQAQMGILRERED